MVNLMYRSWGENYQYSAFVHVYDKYGNPKPNIRVTLSVLAQDRVTLEMLVRTATGYTDANGFVALNCYISWDYDPCLIDMMAYVSSSDYTTIQCSGNYTTTGNTLYPEFWVVSNQDDQDIDGVPDTWEEQIAEKFKPVLHKHHYDKQKGLYNFEMVLDNRSTLEAYNLLMVGPVVYKEWRGYPLNLHVFDSGDQWEYDSFGQDSDSPTYFILNFDDTYTFQNHSGAPLGNRPLYYHVYKSGDYYYLQYWYFFTMNDIGNKGWHEGDWEHVAIKLQKNGTNFTPVAINFYIHAGGITENPESCWWSSTNATTYSNIQQGYDRNHTHLHIWLAANAHSSYNRNMPVYHHSVNVLGNSNWEISDYQDNVDYNPSGHNEYFPYDFLIKLGEVDRKSNITVHGHTWDYHVIPRGNSKYWIGYEGRAGDYWVEGYAGITFKSFSPGPITCNSENHEYYYFTHGTPGVPWNFSTELVLGDEWIEWIIGAITDISISWVSDKPDGD